MRNANFDQTKHKTLYSELNSISIIYNNHLGVFICSPQPFGVCFILTTKHVSDVIWSCLFCLFFLSSAFSEFALQISFDTHSTSISSAKKEWRMMGGIGSLYTTSTSSIKQSRSCPFLKIRDISTLTWQGISIATWINSDSL